MFAMLEKDLTEISILEIKIENSLEPESVILEQDFVTFIIEGICDGTGSKSNAWMCKGTF